MSGIIGGAGSKSGVIGETELDYEEGTWTPVAYRPTNPNGGAVSASTSITASGVYTKTGRVVTVDFVISLVGTITQGSGAVQITGLPFTCSARYFSVALGQTSALGTLLTLSDGMLTSPSSTTITNLGSNSWTAGSIRGTCTYFV